MKTKNIIIAILSVTIITVCGFACYYMWSILSESDISEPVVSDTEVSTGDLLSDAEYYQPAPTPEPETEEITPSEPASAKGEDSVPVSEISSTEDALIWLDNYLRENNIVTAQAASMGLPSTEYWTTSDSSDGHVQIMSTIENTDASTYTVMVETEDTWEIMTEPLQNKYGEPYPVMYFENGLPADSCAFYDQIYEYCSISDAYSTDYVDGQTTCNITNLTTGEVQNITLGE